MRAGAFFGSILPPFSANLPFGVAFFSLLWYNWEDLLSCQQTLERLRKGGITLKSDLKEVKAKEKGTAKSKGWLRPRHRVVRHLAYAILYPYSRLVYRIRIEKCKDKRQFLILYNHQTPFDQFFVGMALPHTVVYYMASEDIFSNGLVSSLIRYLVAPIPIKKQSTDVRAILTCMRVAKEGGTIAIAPEGNRTYSGRTESMNAAILPLVRKLNLPLALYRLEGGYGTHPRWSDCVRPGGVRGYIARIVEPEELAAMSDDELLAAIRETLSVNEANSEGYYPSKKSAEYLERLVYICPDCGLSRFESRGQEIKCLSCGRRVRYTENKEFVGVDRPFPYRYVADWYDAQEQFINAFDPREHTEAPLYTDRVCLFSVVPYEKKKRMMKDASLSLFGDRVVFAREGETLSLSFDEVRAVAVCGKNKINLYHGDKLYQIKGDKRFNAVKYAHIYYRYRHLAKGEQDEQFLGF